ncbi:MAG: 30S ribosome-binding factor RbfA [bacterium]
MNSRGDRIRKALIKELSDIIQHKIKDPRIKGIISVTDVELSPDNKYAKAYISIFGSDDSKQEIMDAIGDSTSFIRGEISKRIRMRHTPELKFMLDESLEKGKRITDLIDKISRGEL